MDIYSGTGVTTTGNLKINKGLHSFAICSSKLFTALTGDELLTLYVERPHASNVEIATNIPLVDFVCESTFGNEAIQADGTYGFIALTEITDGDGAYYLQEGENIILRIDGILAADTWKIVGFEDPVKTLHLKKLERKTVASEDFEKVILTSGYQMAVINDPASTVSEYTLQFSNGERIKYKPFDLITMMRDMDPVAYVTNSGVTKQYLGRLIIPLYNPVSGLTIDSITVNKPQGSVVNFILSNVNVAV